jgi:hypothetical protein
VLAVGVWEVQWGGVRYKRCSSTRLIHTLQKMVSPNEINIFYYLNYSSLKLCQFSIFFINCLELHRWNTDKLGGFEDIPAFWSVIFFMCPELCRSEASAASALVFWGNNVQLLPDSSLCYSLCQVPPPPRGLSRPLSQLKSGPPWVPWYLVLSQQMSSFFAIIGLYQLPPHDWVLGGRNPSTLHMTLNMWFYLLMNESRVSGSHSIKLCPQWNSSATFSIYAQLL